MTRKKMLPDPDPPETPEGAHERGVKEGWILGIKDAIREIERRSQFFRNMGPNAKPAPGVIKLLDEVVLMLKAMELRGSYSSQSVLMSPQLASDLKKIKEQVGRWPKK
jgi:hypothetical protein